MPWSAACRPLISVAYPGRGSSVESTVDSCPGGLTWRWYSRYSFPPEKKKRRTIGSAFLWQSVHEVGRSCRKVHIACLPICHLIATRARHEPSPVISHALARDRPLTTFAHHVSYAVGVRSWCRRLHGLCHPQAEKMLCFDQWP